jgi:hypothetical protein
MYEVYYCPSCGAELPVTIHVWIDGETRKWGKCLHEGDGKVDFVYHPTEEKPQENLTA